MTTSVVCLTYVAYIVIFMAPTATGSTARWALQARHKACMGWSWAAACGVKEWGHIVAAARLQLVIVTKHPQYYMGLIRHG